MNYHHLKLFREVAVLGNLTRAAERLNLSQSALSTQIKQLEARLGHDLFERVGRRLVLTEAGRIALDHADQIFSTGDALLASLDQGVRGDQPLRVGAVSTLSRNFQMQFLAPILGEDQRLILASGDQAGLMARLGDLSLDIVLTTEPPLEADMGRFDARLIDRQPIVLMGRPDLVQGRGLKELLSDAPLIVPTDNAVRSGLTVLTTRLGVTPRITADVDDMAMVRLLTAAGAGVALAPEVVLSGEIAAREVVISDHDLGLTEDFYAITLTRKYQHQAVFQLFGVSEPQ